MSWLSGISNFASSPSGIGLGISAIAAPALLGATALGAGTDVFNSYMQWKNYQNQRDVLNWQKDAQQTTWDREDNATQRRMEDLQAAGLSPTLAAGSAASSSSPISISAPQMGKIGSETINLANVMALLQMEKDFAVKDQNIALSKAQEWATNQTGKRTKYEVDWAEDHGTPLNPNALLQNGSVVSDVIKTLEKRVKGGYHKVREELKKTKSDRQAESLKESIKKGGYSAGTKG